jgi:hypothetical protein
VFGRLFNHANVSTPMLDALGDLLGHTNLRTFEQTLQYAFLERLTDEHASNAYVTRENVRDYFGFPVRFLHGTANAVFDLRTSERSCRLLNEVHGAGAADLDPLKGYGHLDPLIGRRARRDVFPKIAEFLLAESPVDRQAGARLAGESQRFGRRPLVGPVLGWTRWEKGEWRARVWCRADDTRVDPSFVVTIADPTGRAPVVEKHGLRDLAPPPHVPATAMHGARTDGIETLAAVDVRLGSPTADLEVVVWSGYDDPGTAAPATATANKIIAERKKEDAALARGAKATRTADPGYDERMDSVVVPKAVLHALHPSRTALAFALASCRYSGRVIDRELADAMFGKLRGLIEAPGATAAPALLLLVGDQIYADATAGVFDPKSARERFFESYHEAWTAPHARAVLRRLPTYMMMDDHEVEDNWVAGRAEPFAERWGREAFESYQWLHSPRDADELDPGKAAASRYFYSFEAAGFPFFVCDTRTTRTPGGAIMEPGQLEALKDWLAKRAPRRHKFVVSPSAVVPVRKEAQRPGRPHPRAYLRRSDGWEAHPGSLADLMTWILEKAIRDVVFLCGDAHVSMASRIWFERGSERIDLGTRCVVSSPLYAPFPFANSRAEEFAPAGELDLAGGVRMRYAIEGGMLEGDNFAVVHADAAAAPPALRIVYHPRNGAERIVPL